MPKKELPGKYKYHFFFTKHEEYAEKTILISQALEKYGYKIWLSNWKKRDGLAIDAEAMKKGIDESSAVILLLTPGIFEKERVFVTHHELKYAIDKKKIIICIKHWRFTEFYQHKCDGLKPLCSHLTQTCNNVYEDFQPYARTIIDLGSLEYNDIPILENYCFKQIDSIYNNRINKTKKMLERLKFHKNCGICHNNLNKRTILNVTQVPIEKMNKELYKSILKKSKSEKLKGSKKSRGRTRRRKSRRSRR